MKPPPPGLSIDDGRAVEPTVTGAGEPSAMIRVLVVDDDPVAARLHTHYASAVHGFTVVATVGDGKAALNVIGNGAVDLVLLDISLPGFSGIEVLHQLRSPRHQPVDVIVVSSLRDRVTVRQALSSHVVGYLVKPFTRVAMNDRLVAYRDQRVQREGSMAAQQDSFGQGEIDRLLRHRSPPASQPQSQPSADSLGARSLPKGLSEPTLRTILAVLDGGGGHTAVDVASSSGASRATVRRYLDYLHGSGVVDVSHRYGRRGRPELIYRRSPLSR